MVHVELPEMVARSTIAETTEGPCSVDWVAISVHVNRVDDRGVLHAVLRVDLAVRGLLLHHDVGDQLRVEVIPRVVELVEGVGVVVLQRHVRLGECNVDGSHRGVHGVGGDARHDEPGNEAIPRHDINEHVGRIGEDDVGDRQACNCADQAHHQSAIVEGVADEVVVEDRVNPSAMVEKAEHVAARCAEVVAVETDVDEGVAVDIADEPLDAADDARRAACDH
mmetsp:Transcript_12136/g.21577  ORF Transcript_12136/g.21577 Transcript_12136/m.21577 type:complete len:223 (-) Transcript_12136:530-1198(-)